MRRLSLDETAKPGRRHAGVALEDAGEVTLAVQPDSQGDLADVEFSVLKKCLGHLHASPHHVLMGRDAFRLLETPYEMKNAHFDEFGQVG